MTDRELKQLKDNLWHAADSSYLSQFGNGANVIHLKPSSLGGIKILIPNEDLIDSFSQKVGLAISQIDILNE